MRPMRGWMIVAASLMLTAPMAAAEEADQDFAAVQRAFLQEDFARVSALSATFITQHPQAAETPQVWLWMIFSLDRQQRAHEALRELDQLKRRLRPDAPHWPELLFWEGDISRRALQMTRGRLAFQQLLSRYPNSTWSPQAQLGLGMIDVQQQAYEQAARHFRAVAEQQAGTSVGADAQLFEGLCRLRLAQYDQAIAIFEPLIGRLPDKVDVAQAAFYLGESYSGLGKYQEAIPAYERGLTASDRPPWGPLAHFGIGWAHYRLGQWENAVKSFDRYLKYKVREHRVEALFAQGSCLVQLGREQDALSRFNEIVTEAPEHALACESALALSDVHRRREEFGPAKTVLHGLLRPGLTPECRAQVNMRLGTIALAEGNTAQANTVFQLAASDGEPAVQQVALSGLGDIHMYLGQLPEARRFYDQAIAKAAQPPITAYAMFQVGRIYLQLGDFAQAAQTFEQIISRNEPTISDDARLALVIASLNQHDEATAQRHLAAIRQAHPNSVIASRAAYYDALLALGQGHEEDARRLAATAVAGAPGTDEAFEARLLMVDLQLQNAPPENLLEQLRKIYTSEPFPRPLKARLAKRLGDVARTQQAYAEAVKWYEEARQLLPSLSGEAVYRMASCYEEAGDVETAMQWYQQIDRPPWSVRGRLALAKLLEREDRPAEAEAIYLSLANERVPEAGDVQERLGELRRQVREEEAR